MQCGPLAFDITTNSSLPKFVHPNAHTPQKPDPVMSQTDIDAFVESAGRRNMLTPEGAMIAVVTGGISVNGKNTLTGRTALHYAAHFQRRKLVVALLAVGADANAKDNDAMTPMWCAAGHSKADILQLLIDGGCSVNKAGTYGRTPLIKLVCWTSRDAAARLQVLLACPELDLNREYDGRTDEEWAVNFGRPWLASAIAEERRRRVRWSAVRCAWIAGTMLATATLSIASCR